MKDLKYLLAYVIPLSGIYGLYIGEGWMLGLTILIAYGIIPIAELILPQYTSNYTEEEEKTLIDIKYFTYLLYSNVLLVYATLVLFLIQLSSQAWTTVETIMAVMTTAIVMTTSGINVGHDLGHKKDKFSQWCSQILYLPSLYLHFFIEHNRGHHVRVSTPEDPATSRKNEWLYAFWIRSSVGGYLHAWELENRDCVREHGSAFTIHNKMIWYQIIQLIYIGVIAVVFGWYAVICAVVVGTISFLQLETINYIEHYGLMRKKLPSGRYERVEVTHSWNSNHELGRIMLYELTRHSDHHFKASRKYQVLRHFDESPQLPLGYPGSMLLSYFPPLWFRYMNPKVEKFMGG